MDKNTFATRPPMGWNSYDCYDTAVTEAEVRANAEVMAEKLKKYGWEYVIVDIEWYAHRPNSRRKEYQYIPFGEYNLDQYSRFIPDPERFPSSADGKGFRPLADYIHSLGLKFGIHIMRGIPRTAAHQHMAIKNCSLTANEVADAYSICKWNPDMYGVKNTEAGQAYYDSVIELYAEWGVDFIKCDDICNTNNVNGWNTDSYARKHEIEMIARAIDKCGRPIVFSLSPGPALVDQAWHYSKYANMWRITDDFWDNWKSLKDMFWRCELWQRIVAPGCYPDCDMLPLGQIGTGFEEERTTNFTRDEQRTVMSLWSIFGSPLMLGADLTRLDPWTLDLITNTDVLELNKAHKTPVQLERNDNLAIWTTRTEAGTYLGLFNLSDEEQYITAPVDTDVPVGTELWDKTQIPCVNHTVSALIPPHACKLIRF